MAASGDVTSLGDHPVSRELVEYFWGKPSPLGRLFNGDLAPKLPLQAYFDYHQQQWEYYTSHKGHAGPLPMRDLTDLKETVAKLKVDECLESIAAHLMSASASTSEGNSGDLGPGFSMRCCENSIDFAASLLVMTRLGTLDDSDKAPPRRWTTGSLRGFLAAHFGAALAPSTTRPEDRKVRIPRTMDAWSLQAVGGIRVRFTDNLADHLRLVEGDRIFEGERLLENDTVLVFHHACFLELQEQCPEASLLPPGLARETLSTLALLFPEAEFANNKTKRRWLRLLTQKWSARFGCRVDQRLALCGTPSAEDRRLVRYVFWGERLAILKQAYDEATPATFSQWWHDRRNGGQWYPFWIAIMVFAVATLLGVVQCVLAALQLYKAWSPPTGSDL